MRRIDDEADHFRDRLRSAEAKAALEAFNRKRYQTGFRPASISLRWLSRNGGSASFSPSLSIGSSAAKPGPSVAISNRMPFGSRK